MIASYFWIIPILLLLVFVHELGHFMAARKFGVLVKEFALGFPPRIKAVRVGETEYALNALPIGGYVRMEGEDGQLESPRSFVAKSRGQRAVILLAGVTMNALLVPILLTVDALVGVPTVQGIVIHDVQAGSAAQVAGLFPGEVITAAGGRPITDSQVFIDAIRTNIGKPVELTVQGASTQAPTQTVSVTPRPVNKPGDGSLGVTFTVHLVNLQYPIWQAPFVGAKQTAMLAGDFATAIHQMFQTQSVQLSGPIAITQVTGEAARQGPGTLLELTALLSLNLAIFNLFPFPGLDGGRLAMLLLEQLRGRRINPVWEGAINFAGLMVLLAVMVLVSINDIMHVGS